MQQKTFDIWLWLCDITTLRLSETWYVPACVQNRTSLATCSTSSPKTNILFEIDGNNLNYFPAWITPATLNVKKNPSSQLMSGNIFFFFCRFSIFSHKQRRKSLHHNSPFDVGRASIGCITWNLFISLHRSTDIDKSVQNKFQLSSSGTSLIPYR